MDEQRVIIGLIEVDTLINPVGGLKFGQVIGHWSSAVKLSGVICVATINDGLIIKHTPRETDLKMNR